MLLASTFCFSQEKQKRDSLYHKIENYSKKRKASKFIYKLIFRNIPDSIVVPTNVQNEDLKHQGKHIRNVYITSIDPLGYTSKMVKKEDRWYEELGNKLHMKTRQFAARGYLLFKKGDEFNVQKAYESERLLRKTQFISRANISVIDSTATQDSVDVYVRVLDSWSLKPSLSFSGKKLDVGLTEENFFGMGHEVSFLYRTDFSDKRNYSYASYTANNIYGTFINARLLGEKDLDDNENVYFKANREFFSPLTRWAGEINLEYFKRNIEIPTSMDNHNFPVGMVKVQHQDIWGGYQFQIKNKKQEKVTDNIGVTTRFQNYSYLESPGPELDASNFFTSYHLVLASVGYTQRKYSVQRNVFQHELPEDIPYGKSATITSGFGKQEGKAYPYFGVSAGYGNFFKFGYFNYKAEYGTFRKDKKSYQSTFRFDGTYMSPLADWKFAKARHYFSPTLVLGDERDPSYRDRINLSAQNEFPVYNENFVGQDKLMLRYQLQLFVNKSWKNFYYNPYFIAGFGWLKQENKTLFDNKAHSKFGVGLLIYNPYLSFTRFQISFVYYPGVPFDNRSVYDFNNYKNYQLPMNNFMIDKPSVVNYDF